MRIETVRTGGFSMNFCRFGRGGEPLVILPGMGVQRVLDSADAIASAYRALAEDFTLYVFERRNDMPADYPVRDMARDTAAAFEALGLGAVNLFGASQGGMMALVIAAEHPALVKRLALGSTSARVTDARYRAVFEPWAALARSGDAAALYLAFGEALYPGRMYEKLKPLLRDAAKAVTDEDMRRFATEARAMRGFDILDELGGIACPTLVLGAADDRVLGGAASGEIAERVKGAALHMYDGYGHAAYDLAPDYKARLLQFLAGRGQADGEDGT